MTATSDPTARTTAALTAAPGEGDSATGISDRGTRKTPNSGRNTQPSLRSGTARLPLTKVEDRATFVDPGIDVGPMRHRARQPHDRYMTNTQVAPPSTVTIPQAGHYRIDQARSALTFTTRHLFGLGRVTGGAEVRDGEIWIADPPGDSSARARIATGSVHSRLAARDAAVRSSRLLDAAAYSFLVFTSTGLDRSDGRWVLHGRLTVRDQTGPVDLHIEGVAESGSELRMCARTRIDRFAFGVTNFRGLAARYLDIRLDVVASRV